MEKRTLTFLILFFAVLVGSLHLKYKKPPEASSINEMAQEMMQPRNWQGKFAPDFELKLTDDTTFKLSEHIGKEVIVLNFFATWCGPCKEEMPELIRFHHNYSGQGVYMLGINASEKPDKVKGFLDAFFVNYPVGIDGNEEIERKFGVTAFPTTVLIGADGRVKSYDVGPVSNWEIALKKNVEDGLKTFADGKAVTVEAWRKGASTEKYKDIMPPKNSDDEDKVVLEGRAKEIAAKMTCTCGCNDKVLECECSRSVKIKKALKERTFKPEESDIDIIKQLNAEFCLKEGEC